MNQFNQYEHSIKSLSVGEEHYLAVRSTEVWLDRITSYGPQKLLTATGYFYSAGWLTYPWVELEFDTAVLMTGMEISGYPTARQLNNLLIRAGNETTAMVDYVDSTQIDETHPLITVYREVGASYRADVLHSK